jgi:hypothetical protein
MDATFRSWKLPDWYDAPQNGTTKTYSTDGAVCIGTQIRNRKSYFACALENWLFVGTVTPRFKHDDANPKGFRTPNWYSFAKCLSFSRPTSLLANWTACFMG